MKITNIQAMRLHLPDPGPAPTARRAAWWDSAEVANPMSRYPQVKAHRNLWRPEWEDVWCVVTAEDGTWGSGLTQYGRPVAAVIDDHFARHLVGLDCMATDTAFDMMSRLSKPYGTQGLASYAISAVDLALWDLKGKLLEEPVYKLLGGPAHEKLTCYATGNDVDWYQELGFTAFKLACPYGPVDGLDGLAANEDFVARAREQIGAEAELMLDCWMAFDVDYSVRLAERLRPYRLKWIEECLIPEDLGGHIELRKRIPWQTLTTGEHWYGIHPFLWALEHRVADILQPDLNWCGGVTACRKITAAAEAAGIAVILHAGGRYPFGQHVTYASANMPWLEYFMSSPPGVALKDAPRLPGQPVAEDGYLVPSDAPGFGLELKLEWFEPF